ncbi:hypothetical protein GDO81_007936 [Engystomops pustulosus]|uniref:Uncharacterized protein n=1 Tax=Engystomops pustulosus TaxID=76066 RepID=A0AAV7CBQ4_ENGPU|nr:hypothetical protein GDO81_007936 [Engystomops pustulosus]
MWCTGKQEKYSKCCGIGENTHLRRSLVGLDFTAFHCKFFIFFKMAKKVPFSTLGTIFPYRVKRHEKNVLYFDRLGIYGHRDI